MKRYRSTIKTYRRCARSPCRSPKGKLSPFWGANAVGNRQLSGPSAHSTRRVREGSFGEGWKFRISIPTQSWNWVSSFPRLRDRVGQVAGSLPGGEQQICAIARGLMGKPRLLIVDEMSLGLAPRLVKQMFTTVKQFAESALTLLLVEQQIHRAMQIATYAFVLENGTTVLSGKTSELVRHEHIKRVHLGI